MSGWLSGTPLSVIPDATLTAVTAGALLPLLGMWVVLQRVVFLGVALAQVAAAGVALGLFLHLPALPVGLLACLAMVLWFTRDAGRLGATAATGGVGATGDSALGAAFCIASALALLFVSRSPIELDQVHHLLHGNLIYAGPDAARLLALTLAAALGVTALCFRRLLFCAFDPEAAAALGLHPWRWLVLLFGLLAVVLTVSMQTTGSLLSFALLVLPPLAALQLRRGMLGSFAWAAALGGLAAVGGLLLAVAADLHLESSITVCAFLLLPVTRAGARHPLAGVALAALLAAALAGLSDAVGVESPAAAPGVEARHAGDEALAVRVRLAEPRRAGDELLVDWILDLHRGVHGGEPGALWLVLSAGDASVAVPMVPDLAAAPGRALERRGTARWTAPAEAAEVTGQVWTGPPTDLDAVPVAGARVAGVGISGRTAPRSR